MLVLLLNETKQPFLVLTFYIQIVSQTTCASCFPHFSGYVN